jgi:hypothetical protein
MHHSHVRNRVSRYSIQYPHLRTEASSRQQGKMRVDIIYVGRLTAYCIVEESRDERTIHYAWVEQHPKLTLS